LQHRQEIGGQQKKQLPNDKQAEQDLKQAAQQLAAQRQRAEDDFALELVRRFQAETDRHKAMSNPRCTRITESRRIDHVNQMIHI